MLSDWLTNLKPEHIINAINNTSSISPEFSPSPIHCHHVWALIGLMAGISWKIPMGLPPFASCLDESAVREIFQEDHDICASRQGRGPDWTDKPDLGTSRNRYPSTVLGIGYGDISSAASRFHRYPCSPLGTGDDVTWAISPCWVSIPKVHFFLGRLHLVTARPLPRFQMADYEARSTR